MELPVASLYKQQCWCRKINDHFSLVMLTWAMGVESLLGLVIEFYISSETGCNNCLQWRRTWRDWIPSCQKLFPWARWRYLWHVLKLLYLVIFVDIILSRVLFCRLYPDTGRLSRYIKPLAEQMSSEQELRELKELIKSKASLFGKAMQGVKQAVETVELNNQWRTNNYMDFARRLNHMARNFDYTFDEYNEHEENDDVEAANIWYLVFYPYQSPAAFGGYNLTYTNYLNEN